MPLQYVTATSAALLTPLLVNGQLPPIFDPGMIEDIRVELEKVLVVSVRTALTRWLGGHLCD